MAEGGAEIDPDRPYPMNWPRVGHAVIVNNVSGDRPGSVRDVEAMKAAYEKVGFDVTIENDCSAQAMKVAYQRVGFNVTVHNDCSAQQMRKVKKWIMNDDNHRDSNCFAMTIICHGNKKGDLLDKDKNRAWDTEFLIAELSDVDTLRGKPKILTIQACRGLQWNEGKAAPTGVLAEADEMEPTHILPDKADMFVTFSTVPGYMAYAGDDDTGSIYLQSFAKYLSEEYMRRPLQKILTMVRQEMVRQKHGASGMRICSEERNSLIYDVMFSEFHKLSISSEKKKTPPSVARELTVNQGQNNEITDPVPLTLTHLSTHDTLLCSWGKTHTSAGPAKNTLVLFCKKSEYSKPEFMFYDVAGGSVKIQKSYKPLCDHQMEIFMLPVTVKGKHLLTVSCADCHTIRLWDVQSGEVIIAFHDEQFRPGKMCHGRDGVIYCVNPVKGNRLILELDCTTQQFKLKQKFPYSLSMYYGLTYDPVNHIVVISNTPDKLVHGYSCSTGKLVWSREFTEVYVRPCGLVYSEKHKVIIVCAWTQIVVLNPVNGEVLMVVERENKNHLLTEACILNDNLVVRIRDKTTNKYKLLFYSMK